MLFMMVNTHAPESCAFRGEDEARHLEPAFERFEAEAPGRGITVMGSWVNRPGHEGFFLLDAPDPHTIDELVVDSGLVGWTRTRVVSVIATNDAVTPWSEAVLGDGAGRG